MKTHVKKLLVLIPLLLCSLYGSCQVVTNSPDSVLVPSELIRNVSKELAEYDGMKIKYNAQQVIIRGYELDLKSCEGVLQLVQSGKTDCEKIQSEKDDIILDQDKEISTIKKQRNIIGGVVVVLLIIVLVK